MTIEAIYVHALETEDTLQWAWVAFDEDDEPLAEVTEASQPDDTLEDAYLRAIESAFHWVKAENEPVTWLYVDNPSVVNCLTGQETPPLATHDLSEVLQQEIADLRCTVEVIYPEDNRAAEINEGRLEEAVDDHQAYRKTLSADSAGVKDWLDDWSSVMREWMEEILDEFGDAFSPDELEVAQEALTMMDKSVDDLLNILNNLPDPEDVD